MASLHSPKKSENMVSRPFPSHSISQYETKSSALFSYADAWPAVDSKSVYVEQKPFPVVAENPFYEYLPHQPVAWESHVKLSSGPALVKQMTTASQAAQPVASRSNVLLLYALAPTRTGTATKR